MFFSLVDHDRSFYIMKQSILLHFLTLFTIFHLVNCSFSFKSTYYTFQKFLGKTITVSRMITVQWKTFAYLRIIIGVHAAESVLWFKENYAKSVPRNNTLSLLIYKARHYSKLLMKFCNKFITLQKFF